MENKNIKNIHNALELLKVISNESRLLILCKLNEKAYSVGELANFVDLSQPALSQHLAIMREAEYVETTRVQQTIYYSLKSQEIKEIIEVLYRYYCNNDC